MAWRSIEATAFLFILLAPDVSAQRVAGNVLTGVRTFSDGTGMFVIEVRGDLQPKGWPVRPAVGFASASDLFWTQTELPSELGQRVGRGCGLSIPAGWDCPGCRRMEER